MHRRRRVKGFLLHCVAIEPGHRAQPPRHGGLRPAARFEVAAARFEVAAEGFDVGRRTTNRLRWCWSHQVAN
jgi:hypothetical protein